MAHDKSKADSNKLVTETNSVLASAKNTVQGLSVAGIKTGNLGSCIADTQKACSVTNPQVQSADEVGRGQQWRNDASVRSAPSISKSQR